MLSVIPDNSEPIVHDLIIERFSQSDIGYLIVKLEVVVSKGRQYQRLWEILRYEIAKVLMDLFKSLELALTVRIRELL